MSPHNSRPPSATTTNLQCNEQQVESPTVNDGRRYYSPFGQNSNELSMERKRLLRISLQAQTQHQQQIEVTTTEQQQGECLPRRTNSRRAFMRHSDAGEQQMLVVETPKNGTKVLSARDDNIPLSGSRLLNHYQQRPLAMITTNSHSSSSAVHQQQSATRKRRAENSEGDHRLNAKERVWVCADVDRAIHLDVRTLNALLEAEKAVTVSAAQIHWEQGAQQQSGDIGIPEWARARAVDWMQEVCESNQADFVILPLAVAFLDRMLACRFVPRRNLQALASACLLLASKMRAPQPMTAGRLSDHTDNSVRTEELLDWEMLVLNHLQWNLLQSTPFEFFDQLLVRCPVLEALREDFALTLHRMQKVLHLATQLPSVQASACLLYVAVRSHKQHLLSESEQAIRNYLRIDPVSTLIPLFDSIAAALNDSGAAATNNVAAEAQRHYTLNGMEQHLPPSSKRMSLGDDEPRSHVSTTKVVPTVPQSKLPSVWRKSDESSSSNSNSDTTCADPMRLPILSGSPSADGSGQPQAEDDASRSSSSSNSNASTGKASGNGTLVNDSGFHSSVHSDTSHCCDDQGVGVGGAGAMEGSSHGNTVDMIMGRPRLELDRKPGDYGQLF